MDLVVTQFNLGELTTNAQALLDTVREKLKGYSIENYSEENIEAAKKDKAELNAAAERLNKKRIELEIQFNEPFQPFKSKVNEICSEIKKAAKTIDTVVSEVEDREMKKKAAEIQAFYDEQDCDIFPLSKIFNPRWLNKTFKMKDVKAEISAKIQKVNEELDTLDKCEEPEAMAFYIETLDLNLALSRANELKANRERLAAIERDRQEKAAVPPPTPEPVPVKEPGDEEFYREGEPRPIPKLFSVALIITGTTENLRTLKKFMDENNLTYEKIEGVI